MKQDPQCFTPLTLLKGRIENGSKEEGESQEGQSQEGERQKEGQEVGRPVFG
jgi:hypothetical protein